MANVENWRRTYKERKEMLLLSLFNQFLSVLILPNIHCVQTKEKIQDRGNRLAIRMVYRKKTKRLICTCSLERIVQQFQDE